MEPSIACRRWRSSIPVYVRQATNGLNREVVAWCPTEDATVAVVRQDTLEVKELTGRVVTSGRSPFLRGGVELGAVVWSGDGRYIGVPAATRILIFDAAVGRFAAEIEEAGKILAIDFSADGRLMASFDASGRIRIRTTSEWTTVEEIDTVVPEFHNNPEAVLAFHPTLPILATVAHGGGVAVHRIDSAATGSSGGATRFAPYAVAKVVLVGDSGVGKTVLGHRIATDTFQLYPSTHGQQFWLPDALSVTRDDGTRCEVVLWDLAGQADYRLIHVLFLDNADIALIVFDAAERHQSLDAVAFWTKALRASRPDCRIVLVAARADRGTLALSADELDEFARRTGIDGGHLATSALSGEGISSLAAVIKQAIPWDELPMIMENPVLAAIKGEVLRVKEGSSVTPAIIVDELCELVRQSEGIADAPRGEIDNALRDLELRGYVHVLTAAGGERIALLRPEILNNLASSLILEARRNEKGLGAVDELIVVAGAYRFPEMEEVGDRLAAVLAESVIALLLNHNVCFRERFGERSLLVFPELINEKPPRAAGDTVFIDEVTYVLTGGIENVYASLVVLLGYTNVLSRLNQWQNQAQYALDGHHLRFRQFRPTDDRLEIVLSYTDGVPDSARRVFDGLVEQFLSHRPVEVRRYPRVSCSTCGFTLDRSQVIRFMDEGAKVTYCPHGGHMITLPQRGESTRIPEKEQRVLREQSAAARSRTTFAVAMTRLRAYVTEVIRRPLTVDCFVSYAWGDPTHEKWVREVLACDLEEAGITVVMDVLTNRAGDSLARFVERVEATDYVLVVGTPEYLSKYRNAREERGTVVAVEGDLINQRLFGTEEQKATVIPVLREGATVEDALPPLMCTRLPVDFRDDGRYFLALLDVVLALYRLEAHLPAMRELRRALQQ